MQMYRIIWYILDSDYRNGPGEKKFVLGSDYGNDNNYTTIIKVFKYRHIEAGVGLVSLQLWVLLLTLPT
jgi:hypothetical protein